MAEQKITTEIVELTPAMAREWLDKCCQPNEFYNNNRLKQRKGEDIPGMNDPQVLFYAEQMKQGKWTFTGEPIIFDWNGFCPNGRHRITAVVVSGVTITVMVVRGVNPNVFANIDQGKVKSVNDIFRMAEIPNGNQITGGIRKYYSICNSNDCIFVPARNVKQRLQMSSNDWQQLYFKYENDWQRWNRLAASCYSRARLLTIAEVMGLIAYLILEKKHPEDKVVKFFRLLFRIDDGGQTTRMKMFYNIIDREKWSKEKMKPAVKQYKFILVWNDFIQETGKKDLSIRQGQKIEMV